MVTVRLFRALKRVGIVGFDEAGHRMRPVGVISDDLLDAIRREVQAGCTHGTSGDFRWYLQATPCCPLDRAKHCPCEDDVCGLDSQS
jgi:hypothetical protein